VSSGLRESDAGAAAPFDPVEHLGLAGSLSQSRELAGEVLLERLSPLLGAAS
jgi:hypothetical protein